MSKENLCIIRKKIHPEDVGKDAFFPIYKSDIAVLQKCKYGKEILCYNKKPRNGKHHKLVFAMAKCVIDNSPEESIVSRMTPYDLIKELEYENGIIEMRMRLDGEVYYVPKSISYESMNEDEFESVSMLLSETCAQLLNVGVEEFSQNYINYL